MWYGQTTDGSVPAPSAGNGFSSALGSKQVWFGLTRGTAMNGLAGSTPAGVPAPFSIATDMVALNLENPKLATPSLINAAGNGENGWMSLTYADLAKSSARGKALQAAFSRIDTDNTDLSKYKARGGKILQFHGLADGLIAPQGSLHYYEAVSAKMGGYDKVKEFYRLYEVPGMGHCGGVGSVDRLEGVSPAAKPPLPTPNQFFDELVTWVEQKKAPEQMVLTNTQTQLSRPICDFPKKPAYIGGDRNLATSYACKM
jgi:feruloyl esterase